MTTATTNAYFAHDAHFSNTHTSSHALEKCETDLTLLYTASSGTE